MSVLMTFRRRVSPARAGIDPISPPSGIAGTGFPRPCGDRPELEKERTKQAMFPPPVRG